MEGKGSSKWYWHSRQTKSPYNLQQAHYNAELLDMDEDDIANEGYILNKARQEDEEAIRIAPSISKVLRPHQVCSTLQIEHFLI